MCWFDSSPGHRMSAQSESGERRPRSRSVSRSPFSPFIIPSFLTFYSFLRGSIMFSYEHLEVYKKAYSLNQQVYRFLKANNTIPRYAKDQLGIASLSILLNIAEGSAKFSNK